MSAQRRQGGTRETNDLKQLQLYIEIKLKGGGLLGYPIGKPLSILAETILTRERERQPAERPTAGLPNPLPGGGTSNTTRKETK